MGAGLLFIFSGTDEQVQKNDSKPPKKEQSADTVQDKQDSDADDDKDNEKEKADGNKAEEVTAQIKSILGGTIQSAVRYFTDNKAYVVAVGDSLTQGVGDTNDEGGYVGILDNTINQKNHLVDFDNYGKRGNRTDQLLKRLDKHEISDSIKDADIVTITIGANDIMKVLKENITNLSYEDFREEQINYEKRLHDIFDKINNLNPDAEIYLIGLYNPYEKYFPDIPELGAIVKDWNTTGEKVTNEYENTTFIPIIDLFRKADETLLAEDNFHPNTRGYKRMAKRVLGYLTE